MSSIENLNNPQKEATFYHNGPLLLVAGAGAGKTKTVTHRILELIKSGVKPENILAITFTNKAAKEMKERVVHLLAKEDGAIRGEPFMSTFHALGVYILRNHAPVLGLTKFFTILDRDESLAKVKRAMKQANIDDKRFEPRKMLNGISRQKGNGVSATEYLEDNSSNFYGRTLGAVWVEYEKILAKEKALDFDDLLFKAVWLLKNNPDILNYYQDRWRYIHIDEYQDTNQIQYEMSKLLATKHNNICVVGDMDQSIYSWRGADYTNIMNFEKDYPNAKIILLEQNYRSTQNILTAANDVIKKNRKRVEKNLFTENKEGELIGLYAALDEVEEARFIAGEIKGLISGGVTPSEIAILYRANFQSRALEEALLRANVPYEVLGTRFYERKEIKDLMAFIRLAMNGDDTESLKRVINIPARGIGKTTLDKILTGEEEGLPAKMKEKIAEFRRGIAHIQGEIGKRKPSELIKFIIETTGLESALKRGDEEDQERLENLKEFVSVASKYDNQEPEEGLISLVTEATLVSDQDALMQDHNGVRLSTVHASKGLEFDYVFITGLEADLFPHGGFGNDDETRDDEEERRLFYVAITRARKKVYLTYAQSRLIFGNRRINIPSEFIYDIDESLLDSGSNDVQYENHSDYHKDRYHNPDGTTNYLDIDF